MNSTIKASDIQKSTSSDVNTKKSTISRIGEPTIAVSKPFTLIARIFFVVAVFHIWLGFIYAVRYAPYRPLLGFLILYQPILAGFHYVLRPAQFNLWRGPA